MLICDDYHIPNAMSIAGDALTGIVLQQGPGPGATGGILAGLGIIFLIFFLLFTIVPLAGLWKIFTKAGKPGWAAIVPIYNIIVLLQITDNPIWYIVGFIIPIVNFIVSIKVINDLSKAFGKGIGYTLGMLFLPFVFLPLLGFGDARYQGGGGHGGGGAGAQPM
jgi:hypothetical protein